MELIELKTNKRTATGTGPSRRLRKKGQIPAVLYGPKTEPVLLSVNQSDFDTVLKGSGFGQVLFNLVIQSNDETFNKSAMIKELQIHPVSRNSLHIDFYEIDMDRKIKVKVPVTTSGHSKGVELGGTLQIIRRELEVQCLPHEVPESIDIDITDLDMGDSIHLGKIPCEGEVEFLDDANITVLTILSPKVEEVEEPEEEEEVEEGVDEEGKETPEEGDKE